MKRKRSMKALKREADKVFSRFIRHRDTNTEGFGHCVTCNAYAPLQCGHFVKRQHLAVRFDEMNCNGQCVRCNKWLHGNDGEYAAWIVRHHGDFNLNRLLAAKHQTVKMTRADYEALIERYKGE